MDDKDFNELMAKKPPHSSYQEYEHFDHPIEEAQLAGRTYFRTNVMVPVAGLARR